MPRECESRIAGALIGLAVGDALGAPVEFKARGTFPLVTEMESGGYFRLPAGAWTDDTAQALCLSNSLLQFPDFSAHDFLERLWAWIERGENSSTGVPVGIGQNTLRVMGNYRRTGAVAAPPMPGKSDGNGALMRLAPVACVHWERPRTAREVAIRQSRATHHSDLSAAACDLLVCLLCRLIAGEHWCPAIGILGSFAGDDWPEPISSIARAEWRLKNVSEIRSTGFVVHTLEAAMWCVDGTSSFEDALVRAVNLGDDADTVGAVAGQIAGARYGLDAIPVRWLQTLAQVNDLRELAGRVASLGGGG